ncbi:MAG: lipoyl(octanoyl) transferase LipB [Wenzhouxiangellaceae bacterium]
MSRPPLIIRRLGRVDYLETWQAMREFTDRRDAGTADELWLLEHDPVYTQGLAGKPEHVLAPGDIPVIQTDRGGQITYHGPGQLVAYPLLDLERLGLGVRTLVATLEACVIDLLAEHGLAAARRTGAPGVYVDGAKIASIGLKVRRGRSFHGLAFNIDMDLEPFSRINPCGYAGQPMTSLALLGVETTPEAVGNRLATALEAALGLDVRRACADDEPTSAALGTD